LSDVLVLWDVDGTLVDAAGLGRDAMEVAFRQVFGQPSMMWPPMAGRTDRAIVLDALAGHGLTHDEALLEAFRQAAEAAFEQSAEQLAARGRALPGALAALEAFGREPVVQSLLTGNIRRFAEVKLRTFGLMGHVELDIGGYGWSDPVRAHLVDLAREAAAARHGRTFPGRRTVLVGDTPLDVEAAQRSGASVVAVATGRYSVADLNAAGAHLVLADLTGTAEVVAAVHQVARG
jgi:phosphoglycolate phosphatase